MQPLHHDPKKARAYPFASLISRHIHAPRGSSFVSFQQVVALRIELSVTALSGPSGQPVLDYRISRELRSRTETLLLPKQACFHLHLRPIVSQNGRVRTDDLLVPSQARYQASPRSACQYPVRELNPQLRIESPLSCR
jgi:hypothetical protein